MRNLQYDCRIHLGAEGRGVPNFHFPSISSPMRRPGHTLITQLVAAALLISFALTGLLWFGVDLPGVGFTPPVATDRLHRLARDGDVPAMVEFLTQNPAGIDRPNAMGNTALHEAAWFGQEEPARLLLLRHADPNIQNKYGFTPLHLAAWYGKVNVVHVLLEHGGEASIAIRDAEGMTALHRSVLLSQTNVVRILLRHRADPNARDTSGRTPLHVAVEEGDEDLVALLVEGGAAVDMLDGNGRSSVDIATQNGWLELAARLAERRVAP